MKKLLFVLLCFLVIFTCDGQAAKERLATRNYVNISQSTIIGDWVAYDKDSKIEYSFYDDNSIWIRTSDGISCTGMYKFYESVNHKLEPWDLKYWNCDQCEGNQVSGFTFTIDDPDCARAGIADISIPMIVIFTDSNQFLMLYDDKGHYFKK